MADLLITIQKVRNKNKEYLLTDGILDETISDAILDVQIKVFNQVGHLYDMSEITIETLPDELSLAIKDWSAGQVMIDEYPNDKLAFDKGMSYRQDAKDLLANIVKGERRFKDLTKQQQANTIANSIVSVKSCIDTRADCFIRNLSSWD